MTTIDDSFLRQLVRDWMEEVEIVNIRNGWYEDHRSVGDEISLLHSELSEALEEYRIGHMGRWEEVPSERAEGGNYLAHVGKSKYSPGAKPMGFPSEMADVLIRLLDVCKRHNVDLYSEFRSKLEYNKTRGYRHGSKSL